MKRPLRDRKPPKIDKILHIASVRLADEIKKFIDSSEEMSLSDMQKFSDLMCDFAALKKILPAKTKKALKSETLEDLLNEK